jgi:hypothetical protein
MEPVGRESSLPSADVYAGRALHLRRDNGWSDDQILALFNSELLDMGMNETDIRPFISQIQALTQNEPEGRTEDTFGGSREPPNDPSSSAWTGGTTDQASNRDRRLDLLEQILTQMIANQRAPTAPPPVPVPVDSQSGISRARIADPDYFDGDVKDYRRFKMVMKYKLGEDRHRLGEIQGYILSRLTGRASTAGMTFRDRHPNCTEQDLWDLLDRNFLDTQAAEHARNRLLTMRQGKRRLREFNLDFNNYALESGEDNEQTLKNLYCLALKPELNDLLVTVDIGQSWTVQELQERVIRIDENLYRNKVRKTMWTPKQNTSSTDDMDWEPTKANSGRTSGRPSKGRQSFHSTRNNFGASKQRAVWVSSEEINRRKKESLCFRCGKDGHRANKCKLLPAEKPAQVRTTALAAENGEYERSDDGAESLSDDSEN